MNLNFIQGISEKIYNMPKTQDSATFVLFFKKRDYFAPAKKIGAKDKIPSYNIDSASQENQSAQKKEKEKKAIYYKQ